MISPIENEPTIARRMQGVRERAKLDAHDLKIGVGRLGDWREHVRSHPLPAITIAALAGFIITKSVIGVGASKPETVKKIKTTDGEETEVVAKAGATSAVAAMVGTMATGLLKQYLTAQMRNVMKGN